MKKLILVDGSGLIYRGFYAVPPFFKSPTGVQTNAVFGFTSIILTLLKTQKPDYLAVLFDKKGPTFRHKAYEAYKATRVKAPQELYDQIPLVKEVVEAFGIPGFEADGFEADDIAATIAKKLSEENDVHVLIATGDFDLFQLAAPHVSILAPTKGFKEAEVFGVAQIEEKYGLSPGQIPDYKGLAGDHSDNIPGIYGIGEKGAKGLLKKYRDLDGIYGHISEIHGALHDKLEKGKESAFMSKKLATLEDCVPVEFNLEACLVRGFNTEKLRETFRKLGFKSLQKRLDELFGTPQAQGNLF